LFDYIERFYNPRRRHSTLGYLSPWNTKSKLTEPNFVSTEPAAAQRAALATQGGWQSDL
jgi:transposase InsO family protein